MMRTPEKVARAIWGDGETEYDIEMRHTISAAIARDRRERDALVLPLVKWAQKHWPTTLFQECGHEIEQWLAEADSSPGQISPPRVLSTSNVTLGGKPGLSRIVESVYAAGDGSVQTDISYYVPLGGGRIFAINAGPADSKLLKQFQAILATLTFSQ